MVVPEQDFNSIRQAVEIDKKCYFDESKPQWYCQCWTESVSDFPPIAFEIGGKELAISPADYIYKKGFTCYFRILPDQQSDSWILGGVFLRNYYSVFDLERELIGLGRSFFEAQPDIWIQVKHFGPWFVIIVCVCYLICETSIKREHQLEHADKIK